MARAFTAASEMALFSSTAPATAAPLTMSAWFYPTTSHIGTPVSIHDTTSDQNRFQMIFLSTGELRAQCQVAGSGSVFAVTTGTYTTSAWNHGVVRFTSSTSRSVSLNGGSWASNTDSSTPTSIDALSIGRSPSGTGAAFAYSSWMNGYVAEVAVWDVSLTDDESLSLSAGFSPDQIRPDALVGFWKLLDADGDIDWWGQRNLTPINTPTYSQHPPIIYPGEPIVIVPYSAPIVFTRRSLMLLGVG